MLQSQVKVVFVDAFDTALAGRRRVPDAYGFLMQQSGMDETQKGREKEAILTGKTSLQEYVSGHFAPEKSEDMLCRARLYFDGQSTNYTPREEWPSFIKNCAERELDVAVISNLATPYTQMVRYKLPEVKNFFFSCERGLQKPQAEFYHLCCKEMGILPQEAVMVGNSFNSDVCGALQAGFSDAFWMTGKERFVSETERQGVHVITHLNAIF